MRKVGLLAAALVVIVLLALPMSASAETAQTAGGPGCTQWYTIKRGDTLTRIAWRFGTTVKELAAINGISNPNRILAGATICVSAEKPPPPHDGFKYVVKSGDTLTRIGARFGWSALFLAKVNHLWDPNLIFAGQTLWIPAH